MNLDQELKSSADSRHSSLTSSDISAGSAMSSSLSSSSPIDKLRTIKPFAERQLLSFYQNDLLEGNDQRVAEFVQRYQQKDRNAHYDSIVRLEKCLERFRETDASVGRLIDSITELEGKCWALEAHSLRKADRCADGQLVESAVHYSEYHFDGESAAELEQRYYYVLRERLTNEHLVGSYQYKYAQLAFELKLYEMVEFVQRCLASGVAHNSTGEEHPSEPMYRLGVEQLEDWIAALFVYYRKTDHFNEQLKGQCYESLMLLCREYLKIAALPDRLFILNQALRCPSGSSSSLCSLIEVPSPLPFISTNYEHGKELVDYAVTVISTILSPIVGREKFVSSSGSSSQQQQQQKSGQSTPNSGNGGGKPTAEQWLMVDTDFEDELVNVSPGEITEFDLINFLQRVPFEQLLEFMANVQTVVAQNDSAEQLAQSTEVHMMKLFAFNTRLIGILRRGLQSFNCLRFKELTLVIASMIKQIISQIGVAWGWCKAKFTTEDQALLVRLQVEFDSFMLRSIMAILSTNRRGVWPLLAKIEFTGISEAMLWHILWVVYNNGVDDNAELSGLCPYMSANYWKDKFASYCQWKFVFFKKLSTFSVEEATGLIDFFFNMATSRDERLDAEFLVEIVQRIAEICLLKKCYLDGSSAAETNNAGGLALTNQEFYLLKGNICLVNLLNQFKSLTTVLLQFIDEQNGEANILTEQCLKLFESLLLEEFIPDGKFFHIVYEWLEKSAPGKLVNRVARIVLSKLGWERVFLQDSQCLLLSEALQRRHALKLYEALRRQCEVTEKVPEGGRSPAASIALRVSRFNNVVIDRECLGATNRLRLAASPLLHDFTRWCWSSLLGCRLHPLDGIPDESAWDELLFGRCSVNALVNERRLQVKHRLFQQLPRLSYDPELATICAAVGGGGGEGQRPNEEANAFAGYIALMMSDIVVKHTDPSKYIEICRLTMGRHHLPFLNLLYHFVPLSLHSWTVLRSSEKFLSLVLDLVQHRYTAELTSVILAQMKHFHRAENAAQLAIAWTEILLEAVLLAIGNAGKATGWLPNVISGSTTSATTNLEGLFEQFAIIFDRLAQQIVLSSSASNATNDLFERYIRYLMEKPPVSFKLTNIESPASTTSSLPSSTAAAADSASSSWGLLNLLTWSSNEETQVYYLPDRSLLKSEWCTLLHLLLRQAINRKVNRETGSIKANLTKKFQRRSSSTAEPPLPYYLAYIIIEADMRKSLKIWDHLIYQVNKEENKESVVDFEMELKNVCQSLEKPVLPYNLLPINSLIVWLLNSSPPSLDSPSSTPPSHPMMPLLWKNFFTLFFAHSGAGSIGLKFLNKGLLERLSNRLGQLFDYHNRRWLVLNNAKASGALGKSSRQSEQISSLLTEDRLLKLYRAYQLWISDARLHSCFVSLDDDSGDFSAPEYQANILKYIFSAGSNLQSNSRSSSPVDGVSSSAEAYATNFFFLNYIEKSQLVKELNCLESAWSIALKQGALKTVHPLAMIEDESDVQRRKSNDRAAQSSSSVSPSPSVPTQAAQSSEDIKAKIGQYRTIIEYFSSLTSSLSVNLLFDDCLLVEDTANEEATTTLAPQPDPSVIIVIIHQLLDTVIEEARFVEAQLEKYQELNREFSNDILPKLYQKIRREIKKRVFCERDEFDATGCTDAAVIKFEFVESVLDQYAQKKYEQNRADMAAVLSALTKEVPVQKVIGSVYFLGKVLKYLLRFYDGNGLNETSQARIRQLLKSMGGWMALLNSVTGAKYYVTGQVLDLLLETLSALTTSYIDPINYFILETALQRNMTPSMIQQLAPCLSPGKCHQPESFIRMYRLIGQNLMAIPQQTVFVLLSKFDVAAWLASLYVTDEQKAEFLACLYDCLVLFGVAPSDEFLVTFDLYRKHLQDCILYRFPFFMSNILQFMLRGMHQSTVAPTLWNSILHTFGFYTKSLSFGGLASRGPKNGALVSTLADFDYTTFDLDLREYTHRQTILSSHELYDLMAIVIEFHRASAADQAITEFLDHFKLYASKYLQFVSFLSYCWICTNSTVSTCPDDLSVLWKPYFDLWSSWILPKKTTRFIASEHLHFAWELYLKSFQYLVDCMPHSRVSFFCSQLWQLFLNMIVQSTPETIDQKDVAVIEEKMRQLKCWSDFDPNISDIELMYESVIQNHQSIERFLAFVICRVNWGHSLERPMTPEQLSHIVDNLSCVLIALSEYIEDIDLEAIPFAVLTPTKVKQITLMLLPVMKQKMSSGLSSGRLSGFFRATAAATSTSGTTSTATTEEGVLLSLLQCVCDVQRGRNLSSAPGVSSPVLSRKRKTSPDESWFISKNLYYTNVIASLIAYYINGGSSDGQQVRHFLQNWIDAMKCTLEVVDSHGRMMFFDALIASLNAVLEEGERRRLATTLVTVFSYSFTSTVLLGDLILSIQKTVSSTPVVVYLLECFLETYLDLRGDLEFLVTHLQLNGGGGGGGGGGSGGPGTPGTPKSGDTTDGSAVTSTAINEAISKQSCLLLLVHIYHRLSKSTVPESLTSKYVCTLMSRCAHFKPTAANHDEAKVLLYLFKLYDLLTSPSSGSGAEPVLAALGANQFAAVVSVSVNSQQQQEGGRANNSNSSLAVGKNNGGAGSGGAGGNSASSDNFTANSQLHGAVQTVQTLNKAIHETISESLNRGWFFFRTPKQSSNWCLFLLETLVLHGVCSLLELFYCENLAAEYSQIFAIPSSSSSSSSPPSRSSSNDSLTQSQQQQSSPSKSKSHSSVPSYSDSIRSKLKGELKELLKSSTTRLLKTWKKDKSFAEIWPYIDQLASIYSQQLETIKNALATETLNRNTTYDSDLDSLDAMTLSKSSLPSEAQQKRRVLLKQFQLLGRIRAELIQNWLETLFTDKKFIKSFV